MKECEKEDRQLQEVHLKKGWRLLSTTILNVGFLPRDAVFHKDGQHLV
jgi:hypothetical protein